MGVLTNFSSAPTYVKIASQTLGSAAASVTFSSIPSTYTDLVLIFNGKFSASGYGVGFRFNSDSGSNYSETQIATSSGTAVSNRETNSSRSYFLNASTSDGQMFVMNIQNYANTATYKTVLTRTNPMNASYYDFATVGLWRNTNAVTSITIVIDSVNISSGSTFTLYGIKAAIAPKATGGDSISQDGKYWYHTYRTSGIFNPNQSLSVDVLSIAGGGGTTANYGGGGAGAGGLIYSATNSVSSIQTVTVGAGGVGRTNGSNSQFGSLTAAVGGGFGGTQGYQSSTAVPGQNGGSGGGGGSGTSIYSGGTGTAGQGNNGGNGTNTSSSPDWAGGGGGGAGAAGGNASSQTGGAGGAGTNAYASWATVTQTGVSGYFAGGGGGGTFYGGAATGGAAGAGGGGAGRDGDAEGTKSNGTVNTGGGAGSSGPLSSGGSGLVIVRYAI